MTRQRYRIQTWDSEKNCWSPQPGLRHRSKNITILGVRRVLRELRSMGYPCDYSKQGSGDNFVLVERMEPRKDSHA